MPISVVVVDDHTVVRQGICRLLEEQADFQVVADVNNGLEGIMVAKDHEPDVMVLDLVMPGLSGFDVLRQVSRLKNGTRCVILTMHDDPYYVLHAMNTGALGYVCKGADGDELVEAVRFAALGRSYISNPPARHLIGLQADDDGEDLNWPDKQILGKLNVGYTAVEAAEQLNLNLQTVMSCIIERLYLPHIRSNGKLHHYVVG